MREIKQILILFWWLNMNKIKLVEEYGIKIHELHMKLRKELLEELKEKQRNKVIRVLNSSSLLLNEYTNSLYPKLTDALRD